MSGGHTHPVSTFSSRSLIDSPDEDTDGGDFRITKVEALALTHPIDLTAAPQEEVEEQGILEAYGEDLFILEMLGKNYSAMMRD